MEWICPLSSPILALPSTLPHSLHIYSTFSLFSYSDHSLVLSFLLSSFLSFSLYPFVFPSLSFSSPVFFFFSLSLIVRFPSLPLLPIFSLPLFLYLRSSSSSSFTLLSHSSSFLLPFPFILFSRLPSQSHKFALR